MKSSNGSLLVFSTNYSIDEISRYGLEVFHESKNPSKLFAKCIVINLLAFTHHSMKFLKSKFKVNILELSNNCILIDLDVDYSEKTRARCLSFVRNLFSILKFIWQVQRIHKVRLVRSDDPLFNGLLALLVSKLFRVKLLVAYWGNLSRVRLDLGQPIMKRLFRKIWVEEHVESFVLTRAHLVVSENRDNIEAAIKSGASTKNSRIVGLGSMISRFHLNSPKERARYLNTDSPQINFENSWICVARLERVKLVHEVIAAHRFVCTVIPNSILYIIGEGSEQKNLQLQVEINGLEENVVFAGDRSQEFIATIAPNFCLQAAPLSGRSLLELGLAGLPAVAFDTDWHSEIIKDGINGFLVEKGNIKLFADRAIEIMLNRQLRQEFSSAMLSLSNEKVENDNSKILLDVYHELLH